MVDAVSSLVPGRAGGTSAAVEAAAEQGAFPAAMEQALAQPPAAVGGKALPENNGSVLPVAATVVVPVALTPAELVAQSPLAETPLKTDAPGVPVPVTTVPEPPVAAAQTAVANALRQVAEGQRALPPAVSTPNDLFALADEAALLVEAPTVGQAPDATAALATAAPVQVAPAATTPVAVATPVVTVSMPATQATPALAADVAEAAEAVQAAPAAMAAATAAPVSVAKSARRLPGAPDASPGLAAMVGQAAMAVQPQPTQASSAATAARPGATALTSTAPGTATVPGKTAQPTGATASTVANAQAQSAPAEFVFVPTAAGSEAGSEASSAQAASLLGAALGAASATLLPATAGTPAPVELPLAARPGSPGFSSELGERLVWLVNQGVQEARLQLNPRELGPIEVRLGFSDGAAQVNFSVQHAGTAAAVQQSLPQLRELLAQQGLQLGEAGVFQRNADTAANADQAGQQAARQAWVDRGGAFDEGGDLPPISPAHVIGRGLVDAYA